MVVNIIVMCYTISAQIKNLTVRTNRGTKRRGRGVGGGDVADEKMASKVCSHTKYIRNIIIYIIYNIYINCYVPTAAMYTCIRSAAVQPTTTTVVARDVDDDATGARGEGGG